MKTLMVMAGGTGGHIFPGIAVAEELRAQGWRIVWMGNPDGMEARIVPQRGCETAWVRSGARRGKGPLRKLLLPVNLLSGFWQALREIRRARPDVVREGAFNFAFIGQFAESRQRDCIFTTEYSVRTPMEAVYTLLGVERGVPEVFNSTYDVRTLLAATGRLRDGKVLDIPGPAFLRNLLMNRHDKTQIGALLREFKLVTED